VREADRILKLSPERRAHRLEKAKQAVSVDGWRPTGLTIRNQFNYPLRIVGIESLTYRPYGLQPGGMPHLAHRVRLRPLGPIACSLARRISSYEQPVDLPEPDRAAYPANERRGDVKFRQRRDLLDDAII
jgi:hypothetical protein